MKTKIKKSWSIQSMFSILIIFFLSLFDQTFSWTDNSFVTLKVAPLHVTIWSSGDITLPAIQSSFDTGEIQASFSPNSFRLDDRKASDLWYVTTIQSSDLIFYNWIEKISISRNNVRFKTSASPAVIYWQSNPRVTFWSSINNTRWKIWNPVVYFKRSPWTNSWMIWRFWDAPSIKITIPPAQSPGTYTWTIYFTIISW